MSREWPPGWEDPEDAELDAEELDEETDVRVAEVSAFLATVPAPVLPGAIESRIIAALAAESAARAEDSPARAPEPDGPRILRPRPAPARVRRDRSRARPAIFNRIRPAMVAGPLVAILLFAGLGYAISLGGASSSSSSAAGAVSSAPASSAAASGAGSASGFSSAAGGDSGVVGTAKTPHFAIMQSGNRYLAATLVTQVRSELAALRSAPTAATALPTTAPSAVPGSSKSSEASSSASAAAIPVAVRGCVLHLTDGKTPQLVDLATYQGTPAYVIAVSTHVWVVGLDCTAQHPDLIASASLAG